MIMTIYHVIGIYKLTLYIMLLVFINLNYIFKKLIIKIYNDNKNSLFCMFNT